MQSFAPFVATNFRKLPALQAGGRRAYSAAHDFSRNQLALHQHQPAVDSLRNRLLVNDSHHFDAAS